MYMGGGSGSGSAREQKNHIKEKHIKEFVILPKSRSAGPKCEGLS